VYIYAFTMRRTGIHRPTVEEAIELSGIETLHPGGLALTRRVAEVAACAAGQHLLDVSSGRGTQAVYYAQEYGLRVTGLDLSDEMVRVARTRTHRAGLSDTVRFERGDSQHLPFPDASFDAVINECAVGIPDDSQAVLDEMVRIVRPGGAVVIHESTWRAPLTDAEKRELSERYGTTPLEASEWTAMLVRAGVCDVRSEIEPWSRPEMFWNVRQGREVRSPSGVLSAPERLRTMWRIAARHGLSGVSKVLQNERAFFRAIRSGKIGYALYWGRRPGSRT
jgi:SAM-dependent methyltransferase